MKMLRNQHGLTGLEILALIAVLLGVVTVGLLFAWYSEAADNGQRDVCLLQLDKIQTAIQLWIAAPDDRMLCRMALNLINNYNNTGRCAQLIGQVPTPTCPQ
jgi:hypothetical protein